MLHPVFRGLALVLLSCSFTTASSIDLKRSLPESLENWYKPLHKRQAWLHNMFALRRELQAIELYLQKTDVAGLDKWGQRFIQHYRKIPEMVPEWKELTDVGLADALVDQISKREFSGVKETIKKLKHNCRSCHEDFQLLASIRFRSADFAKIRVSAGSKDYDYEEYMKLLSRRVNHVRIAAEDGHWQEAETASHQLRRNLNELEPSCRSCHEDQAPIERILGKSLTNSLKKMNHAIIKKDLSATKRQLGQAAVTTCARCHGVHRSFYEIREALF